MTAKPKRPSRWSLYIPFILLIVVAAGWSILWFQVKAFAQTEIDTAREELKEDGITIECVEEVLGGYPFRLEWTCNEATVTFQSPDNPDTILELPKIKTVAQAYELGHVITEAESPALLKLENGTELLLFNWELGRASVRVSGPKAVDRVALEFNKIVTETRDGTASLLSRVQNSPVMFEADRLGFSGIINDMTTEPFSSDLSGYSLGFTTPTLGGTIDSRWSGVLSGLTRDLFRPVERDAKDMARFWQANGGQFALNGFDVLVEDQVVLNADGNVALSEAGLLQGSYNLRVAREGLSELPSAIAPFLAGILIFGRDEVRNEIAWRSVEVEANQGTVSINGLPMLQTDPVF